MPKPIQVKPGKEVKFSLPDQYITPADQQAAGAAKRYRDLQAKIEDLANIESPAQKQKRAKALEKELAILYKEIARYKSEKNWPRQELQKYKNELENIKKEHPTHYMDPKLQQAVIYIEKHCKQALVDIKKARKFIFRGSEHAHNDIYIANPRTDRQPVDTKPFIQEIIDSYLITAGFTAVRGNSVFCTGSLSAAEGYGGAYMIFPLDGFKFTWSTKHDDWIPDENDIRIKDSPWYIRAKIFDWIMQYPTRKNEELGKQNSFLNLLDNIGSWEDDDELSLDNWSKKHDQVYQISGNSPGSKNIQRYNSNTYRPERCQIRNEKGQRHFCKTKWPYEYTFRCGIKNRP